MNSTPLSPVHDAASTSAAGIIAARTLASMTKRFCLSRPPGAGPFSGAAAPADDAEAGAAALPAEATLEDDAGFADAGGGASGFGGGGSLVKSTVLPLTVRVVLVGPAAFTPSFAIAAWISFIAAAFAVSMSSTVRGALVETSSTGVASVR